MTLTVSFDVRLRIFLVFLSNGGRQTITGIDQNVSELFYLQPRDHRSSDDEFHLPPRVGCCAGREHIHRALRRQRR